MPSSKLLKVRLDEICHFYHMADMVQKVNGTRGSGNVFRDIGFSAAETAELTVKSSLIDAIGETIERRHLTQKEAAALCGTDQPTLSKVLRGRMESVTIDRLASWLTALGRTVEIHVRPYKAHTKSGHLIAVP